MQCLSRPALEACLRSAAAFFHRWTNPKTNLLHYSFQPQAGWVDHRCPVRELGSAYDLAVLQRHLGSSEFDEVIAATLAHFQPMLVHRGPEQLPSAATEPGAALPEGGEGVAEGGEPRWCHLAAGGLGLEEPSTIAHSAMMLLVLANWEGHPKEAQRQRLMAELAAGLLRQQRGDGSFTVHFAPEGLPDSGWELYGGEAAYALAAAGGCLGDNHLLNTARRALEAYRRQYDKGQVGADELVFFANWQSQAGAAVHTHLPAGEERRHLAAYLHGLHTDIIAAGFYEGVRQAPTRQATVEVACALEGLADCLHLSLADEAAAAGGEVVVRERQRQQQYLACAGVAVEFLLKAQMLQVVAGPGVPQEAVGGFSNSLRQGVGQRVDVTGHVACAFIKLLEVGGALGVAEAC